MSNIGKCSSHLEKWVKLNKKWVTIEKKESSSKNWIHKEKWASFERISHISKNGSHWKNESEKRNMAVSVKRMTGLHD